MRQIVLAFLFAGMAAAMVLLGGSQGVALAQTRGPRPRKAPSSRAAAFWCTEADFEKVPGVISAVSGYTGGTLDKPTYRNHEGHVEAVRVVFDPTKVSYATLVNRYWRTVDPLDDTGQFCDKGSSYRTAVFVKLARPARAAEASRPPPSACWAGRWSRPSGTPAGSGPPSASIRTTPRRIRSGTTSTGPAAAGMRGSRRSGARRRRTERKPRLGIARRPPVS
jgi:methionine-S-sulfoxide reductase